MSILPQSSSFQATPPSPPVSLVPIYEFVTPENDAKLTYDAQKATIVEQLDEFQNMNALLMETLRVTPRTYKPWAIMQQLQEDSCIVHFNTQEFRQESSPLQSIEEEHPSDEDEDLSREEVENFQHWDNIEEILKR
ncbi:hypothetical protein FGB62_117g11 [Gracilaria domingensis]|nr:hypothetical protein FGB62_117g11 [Gracilaria domingensis]